MICGRAPRRYRDHDMFWWLRALATRGEAVGTPLPTVDKLPDPRARLGCNPHLSGHGGGHDTNLRRIVRHEEPVRGGKPELSDAHRLLDEQAQRREDLFQQSVAAERTRGDALSKRFEEALRQAKDEPITKPTRDFDLD